MTNILTVQGLPPNPSGAGLRLLRRKQVEAETGYSRSTIYLRISEGLWPKPVRIGTRAVGWPAAEVAAMNGARIAGCSEDEIRELVVRLEASRRVSRGEA